MSAFNRYHAAVETKYVMSPLGRELQRLRRMEEDMSDELKTALQHLREAHAECVAVAYKIITDEKPPVVEPPEGTDRGITDFMEGSGSDGCGCSGSGGCGSGSCGSCKP